MSRLGLIGILCLLTIGCSDKQKEADRLAADMKAMQAKGADSTKDTLAEAREQAVQDSLATRSGPEPESTATADTNAPAITNEMAQTQPSDQPVQVDSASPSQDQVQEKPAEPAETTATAQPIMPPRPVDDGFVVQIASTVDPNEAKEITARFVGYGYPAFPQAAQVDGTVWYRVRVGPYPTSKEATAVLTELNEKYQVSGWVAKHK